VSRFWQHFITNGEAPGDPQDPKPDPHPEPEDVLDAFSRAVVGVADARWGEVGRAYVVPAEGVVLDVEALRAWGRERLASFKVPHSFVAVASLPRTVTGKIQKHRIEAVDDTRR